MIISIEPAEAGAILGAMEAIAEAHGPGGVGEVDRLTIAAAGRVLFGLPEGAAAAPHAAVAPAALASALSGGEAARQACRILAVMSVADGELDAGKVALVREYAAALDQHEDYLRVLTESVEGEIAQAAACMVRKNILSFPGLDHTSPEFVDVFMPYRDAADPDLAARYAALGELGAGTFGRAFFEHFDRNGFAFPGDPGGLSEGFTTPHDSSHVIAGYSTSQPGELCVSTFIGAMHPDHPMAAEVLPVLFSWHLGIKLTPVAGSFRGAYEPERFWTAWRRGSGTRVDLLDAGWDFWAATEAELEEVRREYGVTPVDPALAP